MWLLWIAIAAFAGAIIAGLLGYFSSGTKFSARKYLPTVLRALLAAGALALTYELVGDVASGADIVAAFMAGAGVDVGLHRIAGSTNKG